MLEQSTNFAIHVVHRGEVWAGGEDWAGRPSRDPFESGRIHQALDGEDHETDRSFAAAEP